MLEVKITTLRATFARIEAGEPPTATSHKILTRPDGAQKYVTISVPIRDKRLLARAELGFAKAPTPQVRTLLPIG